MSSKNDSDTIARLALGLAIFVAMKCAPKALEWWNKRKEKTDATPYPSLKSF